MTTPLGSLEIGPRERPPRHGRPDDARDRRSRSRSTSTATGRRRSTTGVGFYDHLLGSLAHHGLFDLDDPRRRRPPDRRAPHGRGRRARAGRRVRRGARRSRRDQPLRRRDACRWTNRSPRPSSISAAGRTPSSTCRSAANAPARCRSSSSSTRSSPSRGPPAPRSTCPGTGRNDHHLAEAAFKALGRALRVACEIDPRREGVASTKGVARMTP